jgi:hypothetical protein
MVQPSADRRQMWTFGGNCARCRAVPRLTGLDLARMFFALRPDLLVILYTGYAERLTETQTRGSNIHAFLTKLVDIGAFFALVEGILKP